MDWFNSNKPGSPVPVIVEIEVGGTDYSLVNLDFLDLSGGPGRFVMESVRVTVKTDLGDDEQTGQVLSQLHLSTAKEMAWAPKWNIESLSGIVLSAGHSRDATRKITIESGELPLIAVNARGVLVGGHFINWDDGEWEEHWDLGDHIRILKNGKHVNGPSIFKWRETVGPLVRSMSHDLNFSLYMAMNDLPPTACYEVISELLPELDYLIHYGDTSPFAASAEQFVFAMGHDPERILHLALTLPWERARYLMGAPCLMLWLEENHPQSPRRKAPPPKPQESEETGEDDEWPPNDMRILFAMRAAQMSGNFSQADADRMDEGPPETWPLDIWQKLGFAPPSTPATDETLTAYLLSNVERSDEASGNLTSGTPITADVNIHASGELYRITRDTKSDPCDGEEVLVYDSVKVDVAIPPRDKDGVPLVLEALAFVPEDEDFPLPHMPPAPPHIGQVLELRFWSHLRTNIQIAPDQRPNLRITRSGVTVADHFFSWETVHEHGNLDQSNLETAYFHGVMLYGDLADLIFDFRHASRNPHKTIIRHLAKEIDFIAAHTRADGFDGSPAGLVQAMNDDPDIIMRAVLAMPWDHARRIYGPAEVADWIEKNHPDSPRARGTSPVSA